MQRELIDSQLGGSSAWEWEFTDVQDGENEKQHDKATGRKLQKQRDTVRGARDAQCTRPLTLGSYR